MMHPALRRDSFLRSLADARRGYREAAQAAKAAQEAADKAHQFAQQCAEERNEAASYLCSECDGLGYTENGKREDVTCRRCGGDGLSAKAKGWAQ